jgi:phosphate starvation-inducible protein PhoH
VHGVGGKIIKAMTQTAVLVDDKTIWFCCGSSRNGKTYTGVAMAVKREEKQVKIILTVQQ